MIKQIIVNKRTIVNYFKNILTRKFITKIIALFIWRFVDYQIQKKFKKYLEEKLKWVSNANLVISISFFFINQQQFKFYILIPVNILPIFSIIWRILFINFNDIIYLNDLNLFAKYTFQALYIITNAWISYKI